MLRNIYLDLTHALGAPDLWQNLDCLEMCVCVILGKNLDQTQSQNTIRVLKQAGALNLQNLSSTPMPILESWFFESKIAASKIKTLQNFASAILNKYERFESLSYLSDKELSDFLISIRGIGFETRDILLLFAFKRPIFVAGRSMHRILIRHRLLGSSSDYFELKDYLERHFSSGVQDLQRFHILASKLAAEFCKKTNPVCSLCPLRDCNGGPDLDFETEISPLIHRI